MTMTSSQLKQHWRYSTPSKYVYLCIVHVYDVTVHVYKSLIYCLTIT